MNIIILALLESVGLPHPLDPNNSAKIIALQLSTLNPSARQFHISTPGLGAGTLYLPALLWVRTPLGAFF